MTSYEIIDLICDAVNPILFLIIVFQIAVLFWQKAYTKAQRQFVAMGLALLSTYGMRLLDEWLFLWPQFEADYSTHTAFTLTMSITLSLHQIKWRAAMATVVLVYAAAMRYQGYHTILDMLSTGIIVAVLFTILWQGYLTIEKTILVERRQT